MICLITELTQPWSACAGAGFPVLCHPLFRVSCSAKVLEDKSVLELFVLFINVQKATCRGAVYFFLTPVI